MATERRAIGSITVLTSLIVMAGCSGGAPVPTQSLRLTAQVANGDSPAAKNCKDRVYVSSYKLNYVDIYCVKGKNQAPIGKITDGISGPEGLTVDAKGNLYVTNTTANDVTEYARGTTSPMFTYTEDLGAPAGVAVDASRSVYVTSLSPASLTIFPQQSNTPKQHVTSLTFPIDVALDPKSNVYVTTYNSGFTAGEVIEFAPGSSQGTNIGIATKEPGGIALDKSGDIVTADQGLPGVLVFAPRKTKPSKTFAQNTIDPDPVRLSHNEKLAVVGDAIGNAVYLYDYPSGTLVDAITDGVDGPNGVALDPPAPL
jgi:sugar lactone lactonase YvrE